MDVLGRDVDRAAYRVAIDLAGTRVVGLIPEAMMASGGPLTGGRGHQTAHEWIARNERQIETTLKTLHHRTGRPRAPFDRMVLVEE